MRAGQTIQTLRIIFWWTLWLAPFGASAAVAAWFVTQSPFAAPYTDRTIQQVQDRLTRAMARDVSLDWLVPRLRSAIDAEDLMQLDLLLGIANDHAILVPRPMLEEIIALNDAASGVIARTTACGACAVNVSACETLAQIGVCALPFELTPAGDVNALRRAGVDYVAGEDIDRLDVGLAVVGLGATGAVLASGGTSYTIKAAASLLRLARRLGTLTPALAARLTRLMGDAVHWDRMGDLAALRIGPAEAVDMAKLGELADLGASLRRVADNTSVAETLSLLRHVDTAQDASRLARVSDALGPQTRAAFEVLGKTRVFRALVRLSDLAIGAAAAIYVLCLQLMIFAAQQCGNLGLRGLRRAILPGRLR